VSDEGVNPATGPKALYGHIYTSSAPIVYNIRDEFMLKPTISGQLAVTEF
jgi:hypothetical protein